jgi:hypothetical protein
MFVLSLATLAFAADPPAEPPTVGASPGRGFTVATADGKFSMNIRGRIMLRETLTAAIPDDAGERDLSMATQVWTARVYLQGHTLSEDTKYVLQLAVAPNDYRDGTISPIFDAYLDLTHNPNASVRIGQLFVPFDRARTNREFALQLATRPRPVGELTLDRDVGVYLYSNGLGGESSPLAYRVGVFGGGGGNALSGKEPGGLGVARVELHPFGYMADADSEGDLERREEPGLAIGAGAAYNVNTNRARSTTSTTYVGGTTDYLHLAGDVVAKWRGAALMGEVLVRDASADEIVSEDDTGAQVIEATRSGWGWLVQPSLMLTDKLEVAGRYSHMTASEGTDPKFVDELAAKENEVAAGLNWYQNGHRFKIQTTWVALFGEAGFGDAEHGGYLQLDVSF